MKKIAYFLMIISLALNLVACASAPSGSGSSGNTSEQQRKNARDAQEELSKDANRGER
jgi:starvation-inducible outer membrane lipoprotein